MADSKNLPSIFEALQNPNSGEQKFGKIFGEKMSLLTATLFIDLGKNRWR